MVVCWDFEVGTVTRDKRGPAAGKPRENRMGKLLQPRAMNEETIIFMKTYFHNLQNYYFKLGVSYITSPSGLCCKLRQLQNMRFRAQMTQRRLLRSCCAVRRHYHLFLEPNGCVSMGTKSKRRIVLNHNESQLALVKVFASSC